MKKTSLQHELSLLGAGLRIRELQAEIAERQAQINEIKAAVAEVPMAPEAAQPKARKKLSKQKAKKAKPESKSKQGSKPGKKKRGGWKHSPETKAKMRKSALARVEAKKAEKT